MATHQRPPAVKLASLPGALPTSPLPRDVDFESVAANCLLYLEDLHSDHFTKDLIWRDTFALTGTLRTLYGSRTVLAAWDELSASKKPSNFALVDRMIRPMNLGSVKIGEGHWLSVMFTFEIDGDLPAFCSGFIGLIPTEDGKWKIWLLQTMLENFKEHGDVDVLDTSARKADSMLGRPDPGVDHSLFDVVIIGGGQAGLSTAGRLKSLGVSYVIADQNAGVGDNWSLRYDSAKVHTPKNNNHLPFDRTFTPEDPEFPNRELMAAAYRKYVEKYDINIWLSTKVENASWDDKTEQWTILTKSHEKRHTITSRYIVMATGVGGQTPFIPELPDRERYHGAVLHSGQYTNSTAWKGQKAIIIGTANTAHDVAEDMVEAGLSSITMIQRNPTFVIPVEYLLKSYSPLYNNIIPTKLSDRIALTAPHSIASLITQKNFHSQIAEDPDHYAALTRAGFKLDQYGDLISCLYERFGGHYLDVGASAKIAKGLINVKSDAALVAYTEHGLRFSDGVELDADVVVFCTGFKLDMRRLITDIFGQEVAEKTDDYWGVDAEGEIRGVFKNSGHPALWVIGGTFSQARFYSRFIALQIKALLLGKPMKIYTKTPFS